MPTLIPLISFDSTDGGAPFGGGPGASLIFDAAGNLLGTTSVGGTNGDGTVFEIANTSTGYARTLTPVVSFNGTNGANPSAGLIADAAGNLFGTTAGGGAKNDGTVFEIANTSTGYASAPTPLVSFSGANGDSPKAGLIFDAAGDLFGTTSSGGTIPGWVSAPFGTVFEIVKNGDSYAGTPTTLANFDHIDGDTPEAGLIFDTAGDLFGTTFQGGEVSGSYTYYGTVFEIANTGAGYTSTPTTLVTFRLFNGSWPSAGLIADKAGDLFGTTDTGYAGYGLNDGTVFELAKTATGYQFTTLVGFNGTDGADPQAGLIIDAAGNLFGTTLSGGANKDGTVFEIANTSTGYAKTPTPLISFNGADGAEPRAGLSADAAGDLFGTTSSGGANNDGTVFELTGTGFDGGLVVPLINGTVAGQTVTDQSSIKPFGSVVISDLNSGQTDTVAVTLSAAANGELTNLAGGSYDAATGVYTDTGTAAAVTTAINGLVFVPTAREVAIAQTVTTTFTVKVSDTAALSSTDSKTTVIATAEATYKTVVAFDSSSLDNPNSGLISNAAGDLFGAVDGGGANGDGAVFEITKTGDSYANLPTTLASLTGYNGANRVSGLAADAAGDLFGTANFGGANADGIVYEIAYTDRSYASTPTTLFSFNATSGASASDLLVDASGNIFGETAGGGTNNDGTVFEIPYIDGSYTKSPITLANFGGNYGSTPEGGLIADAAGDLFGTAASGGVGGYGTVFEIRKTGVGYASTPTILANFDISNAIPDTGETPVSGVVMDSAGDLFGTTMAGGAHDSGTVFELVKTATGYATSAGSAGIIPTVLASLDPSGASPVPGLIVDAAGNLFGELEGFAGDYGSVFELAKNGGSYSSAPITVYSFTAATGDYPVGGLFADTGGNLLGTTLLGPGGSQDGSGTVFELTNTGFQAPRTLAWTGMTGTDFANPGNWTDVTTAANAATAPEGGDTVAFTGGDGAITGTGTIASMLFNSNGNWHFASGAMLSALHSVAVGTGSTGSVFVTKGAQLVDGGTLTVGDDAPGFLALASSGSAAAATMDIAAQTGSSGIVSVEGTGTSLAVSGQLTIGDGASAGLSILNGATVSAASADIGVLAGATGNVDIEGSGSKLIVPGNLTIGDAGQGVLTLGPGTEVTVGQTLNVGPQGLLNSFGGKVDPTSLSNSNIINILADDTETYTDGVFNSGTINVLNGTYTVNTPKITAINPATDVGQITIGKKGTVAEAVLNAGTVDATQTIIFAGGVSSAVLSIGSIAGFAAVIGNFNAKDDIIIQGASVASVSFDNATDVLTAFDGSKATIGTLQFGATVSSKNLVADGVGGIGTAPCFVAGTRISTERGEVAVEALRVGDRVQVVGTAPSPNPLPRGEGGSLTKKTPPPLAGGG